MSRSEYYPSPLLSNDRLRSAQHRLISASCNRWCPASWRVPSADVLRLSEKVPWGALVPKPVTSGLTHSHIRSPPRRKFILYARGEKNNYLSVYLSRKNVRVNEQVPFVVFSSRPTGTSACQHQQNRTCWLLTEDTENLYHWLCLLTSCGRHAKQLEDVERTTCSKFYRRIDSKAHLYFNL